MVSQPSACDVASAKLVLLYLYKTTKPKLKRLWVRCCLILNIRFVAHALLVAFVRIVLYARGHSIAQPGTGYFVLMISYNLCLATAYEYKIRIQLGAIVLKLCINSKACECIKSILCVLYSDLLR